VSILLTARWQMDSLTPSATSIGWLFV